MPRYIEREKFLDELEKQICSDCIDEDAHCCSCGVGSARGIAKDIAAADVVPKSEVEMLQGALKAEERHNELTMEMAQKALKNAKADVAREIFEEIENHLFVIAPIEEFDGWARIRLDDVERLKKKYTEESDG